MTCTTGNTQVHPFRIWTLHVQLVWNHRQDLPLPAVVCGLCFQHRGRMQTLQPADLLGSSGCQTAFSCIAYGASVLNFNEDLGTAINKDGQKWVLCAGGLCAAVEKSHFQACRQSTTHGDFARAASPRVSTSPDAIDRARLCKVWSTLPAETWQSRDPLST